MDRTMGVVAAMLIAGAALAYTGFSKAPTETSVKAEPSRAPRVSANAVAPASKRERSCDPSELRLVWPLGGVANRDWFISNYSDTDPVVGQIRDYTGASGSEAMTYDHHDGIDIEISGFRAMDAGVPILASADGVVEETWDQSFDRNMTCSRDKWNFVRVRHANGFSVIYGHARKDSLFVQPGQRVRIGEKLALVGSSGCSGYPHVHLEVTDCNDTTVDIMAAKFFSPPPLYTKEEPATVMETLIRQPVIFSVADIQDPGSIPDRESVGRGSEFSVGMTVSHLKPGDVVRFDFVTPLNEPSKLVYENKVDKAYLRSHWWGNFHLTETGPWLVRFSINSRVVSSRRLYVE